MVLIHGVSSPMQPLEVRSSRACCNRRPRQRQAERLRGGVAAAHGTLDPPALDLADIWTIMYTSGTTGRPKGAQITYRMCMFNGSSAP